MKRTQHFIVMMFVIFATTFSAVAADNHIPLWGTAYFGMSLHELLAANKDIHQTCDENIQLLPKLQTNAASKVLACINQVDVAGAHFVVLFEFRDATLNDVILSLKNSNTDELGVDKRELYVKVSMLLHAKYGNPSIISTQQFAIPSTSWQEHWVAGLTNIDFIVDKTQFAIHYGADYANDLSNL